MREYGIILRQEKGPKSGLDRLQQYAQIASFIAVPLILAGGGWLIQKSISQTQTEQKYVELALSILREPKEQSNPGLRDWATKTFARYSKDPLSSESIKGLAEGSIVLPSREALMNTNGRLYRVVANTQCPASAWRSITTDSSIEIGLMGVSLSEKRVDVRVRQRVDGRTVESPESNIAPGTWTDLPIPSRTLLIYVSEMNDCWVQYEIKEARR